VSRRLSVEGLQQQLDSESAWRKRELGTIEAMLRTTRAHEVEMLRRAAVALAYAHWEGFVKVAGEFVLSYVAEQRLPRERVNDALLASSMSSQIRDAAGAKKSRPVVELISDLRSHASEQCSIRTTISTASNLNREVFDDVMQGMGIDPASVWNAHPGVTDIDIDDRLLRRRNGIAHGAWITPEDEECRVLIDAVRRLIDATSIAYSNFIALRQYDVSSQRVPV
jgi:hypothetical protein